MPDTGRILRPMSGNAMTTALKLDDEAGRIAALMRYDILDTAIESEFEQIIQLVQRVFDMPMAAVTLVDSERQWFKARRGIGPAETPRSIAFCNHTIAAADGLAVEDTAVDARFATSPLVIGDPKIRSYLGAPLRTPDGYQIGALCILGSETRRFSPEDREILRGFSEVVMSQMELRQLASRDSLTDTLTRRAFDQEAFEALALIRKKGIEAAMMIIDLDHFKATNDAYGHAVGDEVLKAVSATIETVVGPFGAIGRLGGEEFGVLIQPAGRAGILATAERLRSAVATILVPGHPHIRVTTSIGVGLATAEMASVEDWMKIADDALYAAKRGGRDRVLIGN